MNRDALLQKGLTFRIQGDRRGSDRHCRPRFQKIAALVIQPDAAIQARLENIAVLLRQADLGLRRK